MLVDSGFYRQKFLDQWKPRDFRSPADAVKAAGVSPEQITDIIISHAHWDHVDGADLFPKATIWIQRDEYRYYTGEAWQSGSRAAHGGVDQDDMEALLKINMAGRLRFVDGDDQEPIPGPALLHRRQAHLGVAVRGRRDRRRHDRPGVGQRVSIREPGQARPDSADTRRGEQSRAQDRIRRLASRPDLIVPGHDPAVFERYTRVADGIVRIQ